MPYQPIEDYGVIGDMHTAALVGKNGSIDWYCYPYFDSPSVFAAILDDERGGRFKIAPAGRVTNCKQFYWPGTNVLVTRFLSPEGVAELIDYMPVGAAARRFGLHQLVRRVSVVRGDMSLRLECLPAFNYARDQHEISIGKAGALFHAPGLSLELLGRIPLEPYQTGVATEFTLHEGQVATFVIRRAELEALHSLQSEQEADDRLNMTVEFWRHWISHCSYTGRWREMVRRSALVLKLLTFEPSGAIVAAPTASLPEHVGGGRNWDYRYTWMRDAAFTLYGLLRVGFTEEAASFMSWLELVTKDCDPKAPLHVMYSIDGKRTPSEITLNHLEGYRGSRPVRIGNAASDQLQLDIYGELMDSVYLYNKYATPISYDLWRTLRQLTNWVCDNWIREDEGIWEVRGGKQHFVYSKVMCWVAIDRALRLAEKRSFPSDRDRWLKVRDMIYEDVMTRGWNKERQAFVQHYESSALDASNLIMPLVFFLSPTDPRMLKTLDAISRSPKKGGLVSDSLVYRYNLDEYRDGLEDQEGSFNMCTFWLVEAMTRAGKADRSLLDKARLIFEKMLGFANHLGLYAEETGYSGEALGNFPQAFTHLALISAAVNLDQALGAED